MIPERSDRTVPRRVIWSPTPARVYGQIPRPIPVWLTSVAAAGLTLLVFTLSLMVMAAMLVPGAP